MSAIELDSPSLAPEQVRRRQFVTVRRGFDPDQVREFLERVADQMQTQQEMLREARLEAEAGTRVSETRVDPYHQLAARFADTLRSADEQAERIRREATEDARRLLDEARAEADRIRTDAQGKAEEARASAERALREARGRADQTIAGLSTRRDALVDQLARMQSRLLGVAHDLEVAIDSDLADEEPVEPPPIFVGEADRVREAEGRPEPVGAQPSEEDGERARSAARPIDAGYDALWEGTETIQLEVPDIPPLDLSWGDDDDV